MSALSWIAQAATILNVELLSSHMNLQDAASIKTAGYTFYWKGLPQNVRRIHGVCFAIKNMYVNNLQELPIPINERLMTLRLPLAQKQMLTIISAYAPTMDAENHVKEDFYDALDKLITATPAKDMADAESCGIMASYR